MILYTGPTGSSNITVYPSTEYLDTLNLCGEFYTGSFSIANNGTAVVESYQQKLPLFQDANIGGVEPYKTSLIIPPDLLYGCTANCSCYKVVSTTYGNDKLIGIIPKHLLRYISSSSNDYNSQSLNLFEGCIIIPNYVGTYVTYNEREVLENEDTSTYKTERYIQKTYNVYTFIPEGFIQNTGLTSLYGLYTFHIHWPKQSYKVNNERVDYDFYVMSTTNSFHNKITNINFNNSFYNYYGRDNMNYYDYNSYNRGIHFNFQCTYNIDDKVYTSEEKTSIFGDLYLKYPNICRVFNGFSTGINLNIFKTLQVHNLINNIYLLMGYFGNIFEGSTVENLKILSGYCINIANGNINSISCNAIFPPMNKNIRNFIISNTKYNLYNSQIEDNNITYYKAVYSGILNFRGDSAVRPQYLDIE